MSYQRPTFLSISNTAKFRGQADTFDSPVIVLQANWELYTIDRGETRVY